MATPIFCCGFECGVASASAASTHIPTTSSAGSFSTTTVRTGLRSRRLNPSAVTSEELAPSLGIPTVAVGRIYFYIATNPTANALIFGGRTASIRYGGIGFQSSDSTWRAVALDGTTYTFGATGLTLATATWHYADIRLNVAANPWVVDVTFNGTNSDTVSPAIAATTVATIARGDPNSKTFDIYFDDLIASVTSADYPIGAGKVLSYIPNADGTHNIAGANDFERTLTGTDITNATTTAYQLIDDRPLESAAGDFINGIAPPNATDYVEWLYEDSVEANAPRTVEAIFGHHDAGGAGTNNFTVTLRRNDTGATSNIFTGTTNVGATLTWKRAHFATAPGGAAWTTAIFNDLRSRFLVTDASPDPYIDGIMLEAEFSGAAPPAGVPDPVLRTLMGVGV